MSISSTVILMGTDWLQSPLFKVQTDLNMKIRYLPFGFRGETIEKAASVEFQGQLRDALTGHYLLGHGYRAYDSIMRRFLTPDSLSPFGEGGLNCYVYCGGEPVNNIDPSGHFSRSIGKRLSQFFRREKNIGVEVGTLIDFSGRHRIYNPKVIAPNITAFETQGPPGFQKAINFSLHGSPKGKLATNGNEISARGLIKKAQAQGINFNDYDVVHVAACYSGLGDIDSKLARIVQYTGKPATGYSGRVLTTPVEDFAEMAASYKPITNPKTAPSPHFVIGDKSSATTIYIRKGVR